MAVEQINAFRSSDGRLYKTEAEALRHELYLRIDEVFEKAYGRNYRFDYDGIGKIIQCRKDLLDVLASDPSVALYRFEK